jgi:RNA polymerase sigma-70 factor (ECF subfamily)
MREEARRKKREEAGGRETMLETDQGEDISDPQMAKKLREQLAIMPAKQRECLILRFDAELSYAEIGRALGMREGAARANVFKGIKKLRERLQDERFQ